MGKDMIIPSLALSCGICSPEKINLLYIVSMRDSANGNAYLFCLKKTIVLRMSLDKS
jgi:hypothetical protein